MDSTVSFNVSVTLHFSRKLVSWNTLGSIFHSFFQQSWKPIYVSIIWVSTCFLPPFFLPPSLPPFLSASLSSFLSFICFSYYLSMCLSPIYQLSMCLSSYLPVICLLSIDEHIHSALSLLGMHVKCLFCITSQRLPVSSSHN